MKNAVLVVVLPPEIDLWDDRVRALENAQMSHVEMGDVTAQEVVLVQTLHPSRPLRIPKLYGNK